MKKYLMLFVVAAALTTSSFAQTNANHKNAKPEKSHHGNVPPAVTSAFAKQYPGATAKWKMENGSWEANFKQSGNEMSAVFDSNGTMTESEKEIKVSELPPSVPEYVKTHYKGEKIKEASKITKSNGVVNYEATVKGKELLFDSNGNFAKLEKR
jgi:hypothetical protein